MNKNVEKVLRHRAKKRELISQHKRKKCTDCDIQYPDYVMQFDHVPELGIKLFQVSDMSTLSYKRILEEISKCEVVCANCHAERTHRRRYSLVTQR
jgi:hypothetical protein